MEAQRACLWCATVKVFGLRKIEIDAESTAARREHTKGYDKRVTQLAKVVDLTNELDLDIAEVDYDVLNISCIRQALENGTGIPQPLASAGAVHKACALAALISSNVGVHIADI